jgi:sterol-4alpha-carboxylate 3-dehydrogenase (decarboxylating)
MSKTEIQNLGPILVTGGTSYLGSHIVETLLADGPYPPVVSSVEPQVNFSRRVEEATYHDCDLLDPRQVDALLDKVKPRAVVHTLGANFFAPPKDHYRITYDLSRHFIVAVKKHPSVQALVFTSTVEAVALRPSDNDHPVREDEIGTYSLNHGPMVYSRVKAAIDTLVRESNTPEAFSNVTGNYSNQLLTAVIRMTGMYGPRDGQAIEAMLELVNTPKTQFQTGPNELVHDWCYVYNAASVHMLAAKALIRPPTEERADGQAFNVSDGSPTKFWDFARMIWKEAGDANWADNGPHKVKVVPFWVVLYGMSLMEWLYWIFTFGLLRPKSTTATFSYMKTGCWMDISKARRVLGYEPLVDTKEGIKRTVQLEREHGDLKDKKNV